MTPTHTLLILDPGHFHAALVLREAHPQLADDIHVYAEPGPDLDRFLEMAASFNRRAHRPTRWNLHLHPGPDGLERLIADKRGDVVLIAGRNDRKMAAIERLGRSGFAVLADKPWVIADDTLPLLRAAMAPGRPITLDIMTERFEITTLLQKAFMGVEAVFGRRRIDADGSPTVFKESVHHLYKIVNERPLVRPPWYFDIQVQGEGLVDVTSHLVDMTHWMLFPGRPIDFQRDMELLDARRWATTVPLDLFRKITRVDGFPPEVASAVQDDRLTCFCNGELRYRVNGVPVHLRVIWNLEIPPGGGDMHRSCVKGTRSDLLIRQLPEHDFKVELLIAPRADAAAVEAAARRCLADWQDLYPGLVLHREGDKLQVEIPDVLRTTHEEHFCQVRDTFLDFLTTGACPPEIGACNVSRYTLLAEARRLALRSPFAMLTAG